MFMHRLGKRDRSRHADLVAEEEASQALDRARAAASALHRTSLPSSSSATIWSRNSPPSSLSASGLMSRMHFWWRLRTPATAYPIASLSAKRPSFLLRERYRELACLNSFLTLFLEGLR